MKRDEASDLDERDPLAPWRREFVIAEGVLYLDGNSLGRLPREAVQAMTRTIGEEWGVGLVGSWRTEWLSLPRRVGDALAPLIGADAGEVLIADQTSVNLFKLASAALEHTGRSDIVSDSSNFPSDRYVLEGVATSRGGALRILDTREGGSVAAAIVAAAVDDEVGLVALSHIDYRSGAVADMPAVTAAAHDAGALALWDLSHSAGVYPVHLGRSDVDLAVGCTYKYLNGGPGSPAFLFVRTGLQDVLQQPIHGWFGHADQFGFAPDYLPAAGIARFAVGTPPIVSLRGAEIGIRTVAEAGLAAIRAKSSALTELLLDLFDRRLAEHGFRLVSPRRPDRRGGHVGVAHPSAWQISQALVARDVIPDFRSPDVLRLAPSPLYTRFVDVWDAIEILVGIVRAGSYGDYPAERDVVT